MSKAYCSCGAGDTDSKLRIDIWACCDACAKRKTAIWKDRSERGMKMTNIPQSDSVWQMRIGFDTWYMYGAWNEVTPSEVDELNRDMTRRGMRFSRIEPNRMRGKL